MSSYDRFPTTVVAGYGSEAVTEGYPIRFDFLDTVGGQNLSLQVHPTTE